MGSSSSTRVPKPKPLTAPSMQQDISSYVGGYGASLPGVLGFEKQYRPEFGALNLADIGQYQRGLQGLQGGATRTAQAQIQAAQEASIGGMTRLSGQARGLMEALSPRGAELTEQSFLASQAAQKYADQFNIDVSGMTNLAQKAYQSAESLSPEQIRSAEQTAREAGMMSGRVGGSSTVAAEILNREAAKSQRRSEAAQLGGLAFQQQSSLGQQKLQAQEAARQAGQQALGQQQSFYTQPIFGLLGSTPQSYAAGQQFTEYGMGMLGKSTPGLINPDVGLNLAAAGRRDLLQSQSAQAQASASRSAGMMGGIGSAIGGIATAKAFMMCIPSGEFIDTIDGKKLIDEILPNDKIIGFNGHEVIVLQKHSYGENPEIERFVKIQFDDNSSISLCDKHKVNNIESQDVKVGDCINKKTVVSIEFFGGVEISYDLLTSDRGYQMSGISVNSMIPDLINKIIEIQNEQ